jgi:hypothetical protein
VFRINHRLFQETNRAQLPKMSKQDMKREAISLAIKDSIRLYYQTHNQLKINDMVLWAEENYGIPFLPATMHTILFPKPKKNSLWTSLPTASKDRQRERPPNWPELELELAKWYISLPAPPKGQAVKEKANELWQKLAPKHYIGQKQPSFGDSWRDKFKYRHGFKLRRPSFGEALIGMEASIAVDKDVDRLLDIGDPTNTNISIGNDDEIVQIPVMQPRFSRYKSIDVEKFY